MPENKNVYERLKKLFSNGPIVRNIGGKELKVADTDDSQDIMTNARRDKYSAVHASSGYMQMGTQYGQNMAYQSQRIMLFRDYDMMDTDPMVNSACDIYADESTVKNEYGDILSIESDNTKIKDVLHNLFYDILNIEHTLYMWTRNLCKYGDFFLFLEISEEHGIVNVMPLSVYDTVRVEGEQPENPNYVRFETLGSNGYKQKFENFEMAHFRLLADSNFLPYGKSMLEGGRRAFRQLTMMEDAMLIHRIMRAPEKRVFKIDVGNVVPGEVDAYIEKLMAKTKKVPFQDPQSGEYNLRYNMMNLLEDFYIPVRGSQDGTSIENLSGLSYDAIDDVEYIRDKLLAGLKIPRAFLGYEEDVNGKATLAAEDVRFSRTIDRIQRMITSELTKIAIVHLYAQGFEDEELVDFTLRLTNPSTIAEQEKINLWTQKVALMTQMQGTKMFPREWMLKNVFAFDEETISEMEDRLVEDTKYMFRLTQIENGQQDPAKFGYPQDDENNVPPTAGGAPGGGEAPGGAPGGAAPAGGPPAAGSAPMVNSVDELPTAAELGLEESIDEIDTLVETDEEDGRGQPRKGSVYGQDSHVRGRDPLGFKAQYGNQRVSAARKPTYKSPLALESALRHVVGFKRLKKETAQLNEDLDKGLEGTFLDENIVLPKDTDIE